MGFLLIAVLALVMVYAMMESAATFLTRQNREAHPSSRMALLERLTHLEPGGTDCRLAPGSRADLEVRCDLVPADWRAGFSRVKLTTQYRAWLVLDEERHEVRWFEMLRTASLFIGFRGWVPRFSWSLALVAGCIDVVWVGRAYGLAAGVVPRVRGERSFRIDTVALKRAIRGTAGRAGWPFRPRLWWFQVRRRADGTIPRGWIPAATRFWTERQFWTTGYVLLYLATVLAIVVVNAGWGAVLTWNGIRGVLGFSAFWWTIWAFIMGIFWLTTRPN